MTTEATEITEVTGTGRHAAAASAGRPDPGAAGAYLGELFDENGRMVLGLCRLLLRDQVEAEDAAQQVFLSAHRSILAGAVPREPTAWLAAIARNECRARIRARMREPLALPELPDDLPDPLASALLAADLDAVWTAISELPRRQRKALLLRELGGLSYGELGAALGLSRPAVESLLFRARRQLRRALAGANAAFVPVALRDQLAQLVPGFGAAPAAAIPIGAKVAALTAGAALVASGGAELPHHQLRRAHTVASPVVVRRDAQTAVTRVDRGAVSERIATRASEPDKASRRQRFSGNDRERRRHDAGRSEPEHHDQPQAHGEQQHEGQQGIVTEDHSGAVDGGGGSGDGGGGGEDTGSDGSGSGGGDSGFDGH